MIGRVCPAGRELLIRLLVTSVRQECLGHLRMLLIAKDIYIAGWGRPRASIVPSVTTFSHEYSAANPNVMNRKCNLCKYLRHLLALWAKLGYIFLGCHVRRADV